jgi:sugar phosphate isomerase/epimerase
MNHENKCGTTRRRFMKIASAGIGVAMIPSVARALNGKEETRISGDDGDKSDRKKIRLGIASYTFRKFSLEDTLKMTNQLAIDRIALKSFHLPLDSTADQIKKATEKVKSAGITLYGAGVIYMKDKEQVDQAFAYAKTAGIEIIIGVPDHRLLPLVEAKVQETDIMVAIHNHGPGDQLYPSPESIFEKIELLDKRLGLCIDVGHVQRFGLDPVEEIKKYGSRLLDIHMKDVNGSDKEGQTVEIGRGIIDIPGILTTLDKMKYSGTISFEYEKDEENPLPGLAESVGYVRGVLAVL